MILRIVRAERAMALRQAAKDDADRVEVYATSPSFDELHEDDLVSTTLELPDVAPVLTVPEGTARDVASYDADNAIRVYQYLGEMTRTQAVDSRLWVTLAHTTFWSYVQRRWGQADRDKLRKSVLRHWFVPQGGGKAALRTQAISRLWWASHLTHAPWQRDNELSVFQSADDYRFTKILLKRQQIYFDLIERDFGSDLRLRICILDALDNHLAAVSWKDGLSRDSAKRLNLVFKHRQVASLPVPELRRVCADVVGRVATSLAGNGTAPPGEPAPE